MPSLYGLRRASNRGWFGPRYRRRLPWLLVLFAAGYVLAIFVAQREPTVQGGPEILLYRHDIGATVSLDLERYILGVVAAEMPATFHIEALKAQAVAARTYALYTLEHGRPLPEAPEAILSTDHRSAQAWISQEAFWERWGREAPARWRRIAKAVSATRGQVLVYDGRPILAVYHSSSGGHTENSENYWSGALPYLQGQPDPFDSLSPYRDTVTALPVSTVYSRLNLPVPAADAASSDIAVIDRFPSGRVNKIRIGDQIFTGRQIRETFGLRSSLFSVDIQADVVHFIQQGYGHGIGMSQYGAHGMGEAGYAYDEILRYYYRGTQLVQWYE